MRNDAGGTLWVVATPIGNLDDFAPRAVAVLQQVDVIAAEDTRTSHTLLARYGIATPTVALHEHNERAAASGLVARMQRGESVALISDAGTPLLSDPGFHLVREAHAAGIRVSTVPGPSAPVAALSVSGLPTDRFVFEGFLPAKNAARRARLKQLADEPRTLVFFESKHRIAAMLSDLCDEFGPGREAAVARELTKLFETVLRGTLATLAQRVAQEEEQRLGEFVVVVGGAATADDAAARIREGERVFRLLAAELPASRAARLAAEITGAPRNALYKAIPRGEAG